VKFGLDFQQLASRLGMDVIDKQSTTLYTDRQRYLTLGKATHHPDIKHVTIS